MPAGRPCCLKKVVGKLPFFFFVAIANPKFASMQYRVSMNCRPIVRKDCVGCPCQPKNETTKKVTVKVGAPSIKDWVLDFVTKS